MNILTLIGVITVSFVFIRFLKALGKRLPILELMLLIAGLQWIVGPAIEYFNDFDHFKYYMYVDEWVYMSYVVPGYLVYVFIILYGLKKEPKFNVSPEYFKRYSAYGLIIFIIGVACDLIQTKVPNSLQFLFFLLANFKYVGALILLFSKKKQHRYLFYGAILYLSVNALRGAMFHDFILWSAFFYMFWAYKVKPTLKTSMLIFLFGFVFGAMIQIVKADFRALIWEGYGGNKLELFTNILSKKISGGFIENNDEQGNMNVRLNQGWIISAVMENTPKNEPFANGETIFDAVKASALPRFLNPDKKQASDKDNFTRFTGLEIGSSTSMGISLIGEGYANFGVFGGVLFICFWGLFIITFWNFLMKKAKKYIILIFFLPLVYLQVIKAETELLKILNHLVKATFLMFIFIWYVKNYLGWKISLQLLKWK